MKQSVIITIVAAVVVVARSEFVNISANTNLKTESIFEEYAEAVPIELIMDLATEVVASWERTLDWGPTNAIIVTVAISVFVEDAITNSTLDSGSMA